MLFYFLSLMAGETPYRQLNEGSKNPVEMITVTPQEAATSSTVVQMPHQHTEACVELSRKNGLLEERNISLVKDYNCMLYKTWALTAAVILQGIIFTYLLSGTYTHCDSCCHCPRLVNPFVCSNQTITCV